MAVVGPAFIGFIMGLSLYGTTLAQAVFYFISFPNDSKVVKKSVHSRFLQKPALAGLPWQLTASFVVVVFVSVIVQGFFCLRVWKISGRNWFIVTFIALASAIQFSTGIVVCIGEFGHPTTSSTLFARLDLISALVCDAAISASLVYFFYSYRIGQPRTEPVLQQLIVLSVNMGVLLCLVTGAILILFETRRGSATSLAPQFISNKLYINALIGTLNSRRHLRELVDRSIAYSLPTVSSGIR